MQIEFFLMKERQDDQSIKEKRPLPEERAPYQISRPIRDRRAILQITGLTANISRPAQVNRMKSIIIILNS